MSAAGGIRLTAGERRVFRRQKKISCSAWAERHRVVSMSSLPGPWRNAVTPYLAGIMDAIWTPGVETVIVCKAPQTGGTEAAYNAIAYAADCNPGPVLVVMPDEITARDNARDRIIPIFEDSPRLRRHLTGRSDDLSALRINLVHMPIYMAWARSTPRLANKPIRMVVFDETDKYPDFASAREADPISLGVKRTLTFRRSRKIVMLSTPTVEAGPIWRALTNEAQCVYDYLVVCPSCRAEQYMAFERIVWPETTRDPKEVEDLRLARYVCSACGDAWDDARRDIAVRAGAWRVRLAAEPEQGHGAELSRHLRERRPQKVGFHLPSWLSHFVSLSDAAAAFLRGLADKAKLRDFQNAHAARPWAVYEQTRREDQILALRDDRPRGRLPAGGLVQRLTAGIDTQDDGLWYAIFAWGWAPSPGESLPCWEVRSGFALGFEDLARALWEDEITDAAGRRYVVSLAFQDAGGHRTKEVYDFCRRHPGKIFPAFGRDSLAVPHTWSRVQYYPGTKRPIPGGLRIVNINTKYFKDELSRRLSVDPGDAAAVRFCAEFRADYARHYTAEALDERGRWACPPGRANHLWDCAVLAFAAADVLDLGYRRRREERPQEASAPPPAPAAPPRPLRPRPPRPRRGWMAM